MGEPFNLSVLISQMPRVQKMQGDIQAFPQHMQGQLAKEVLEKQKREQSEVGRTNRGEGALEVKLDKKKKDREQEPEGSLGQREEDEEQFYSSERGRLIDLQI